MAVPKKRTGKAKQAKRRANWKATKPEVTTCKDCGKLVLTHTICTECGKYKGKVVSIKDNGYIQNTNISQEVKTEDKNNFEVEKQESESIKTEEANESVSKVNAEEEISNNKEEPKE